MDYDQDGISLTEEQRQRIISAMMKMMKLGIGVVYGQEDEAGEDVVIDCAKMLKQCNAKCCSLTFALTKDEVGRGNVRHDPEMPFFVLREKDGFCYHFNRLSLKCTVWEDRPERCRRYDCRVGREEIITLTE